MALVGAIWQTLCFLWLAFWVFAMLMIGDGNTEGMVNGWWLWMLGIGFAPTILTAWLAKSASKSQK